MVAARRRIHHPHQGVWRNVLNETDVDREPAADDASPALPVTRPSNIAAVIMGRRSVRAFDTRPVPRVLIERAIEAAGWAPSPHGSQPWRFVVIESRDRRLALADAMSETWRAQLALDGQDDPVIARRLAHSRERLERAPVLVLVCLYLRDLQTYPDRDRQDAEHTMAVQSLGAA